MAIPATSSSLIRNEFASLAEQSKGARHDISNLIIIVIMIIVITMNYSNNNGMMINRYDKIIK